MIEFLCEQCNKQCSKKVPGRFCDKSCSNKWQHANGKRNPRFPNLVEAWTKKFGLEEALRREAIRNAKHSISTSGDKNHFFGRDHSLEFKEKSSLVHKGKIIPHNVREKMSKTHSQRIASGVGYNPKEAKTKHGNFQAKDGTTSSYVSSYELERMQFLDSNTLVQSWSRKHCITIPYELAGVKRNYIPDFLVVTWHGIFLEETKGYIRNQQAHVAKCEAAIKFCAERGWSYRVLFKKDLETL